MPHEWELGVLGDQFLPVAVEPVTDGVLQAGVRLGGSEDCRDLVGDVVDHTCEELRFGREHVVQGAERYLGLGGHRPQCRPGNPVAGEDDAGRRHELTPPFGGSDVRHHATDLPFFRSTDSVSHQIACSLEWQPR